MERRRHLGWGAGARARRARRRRHRPRRRVHLAAAPRRLPHQHPARRLGRSRRLPRRPDPGRRAAASRPRLPVSPHRPRAPGRPPDQVALAGRRGAGVKAVRVALALAGLAALVRGLVLLVDLGPRLPAVLVWALGGIVLHDGVLAPLVVLLGVLAASRTPAWLRAP